MAAVLLAGCASETRDTSDPEEREITNLSQVDVLSPGVIELVRQFGQIDIAKDPRVICVRRAPLGSNIPKVVCMTRIERDMMAMQAERELALIQDEWERKYDVYTNTQ